MKLPKKLFSILGENGVIRAADQHACLECTHDYIATTSDNTPTAHSAAVVGVDENVEQSSQHAADSGSSSSGSTSTATSEDGMDVDKVLHPTSGTPRNSTGSEISDPLGSSDQYIFGFIFYIISFDLLIMLLFSLLHTCAPLYPPDLSRTSGPLPCILLVYKP